MIEWSELKKSLQLQLNKRWAIVIFSASLLACMIIVPPFYLGTRAYPMTIVNGNSMFPNLQNGDLVIFKGLSSQQFAANGSVIVYVEGGSGNSILDSISRPVIIHRIVGTVLQSD